MEGLYPYFSPQILTDALFVAYGGHTGTTVDAQRSAAYWLAEKVVSEEIDTYLVPTIVTGTFYGYTSPIQLNNSYVTRIVRTSFIDFEGKEYFAVSGTSNSYVAVINPYYGLIEISNYPLCGTCGDAKRPYQIQVVYETGFTSGSSYSPDILLALVTYSDIMINEIIGYGNEAPGDIGVQDYKNQQYSETRVKLQNTNFGNSPRAIFCHRILSNYKRYKVVGL